MSYKLYGIVEEDSCMETILKHFFEKLVILLTVSNLTISSGNPQVELIKVDIEIARFRP